MSVTQAAYQAEKALGHGDNNVIQQDVTNYQQTGEAGQSMKALVWQGKSKVEIGRFSQCFPDHHW